MSIVFTSTKLGSSVAVSGQAAFSLWDTPNNVLADDGTLASASMTSAKSLRSDTLVIGYSFTDQGIDDHRLIEYARVTLEAAVGTGGSALLRLTVPNAPLAPGVSADRLSTFLAEFARPQTQFSTIALSSALGSTVQVCASFLAMASAISDGLSLHITILASAHATGIPTPARIDMAKLEIGYSDSYYVTAQVRFAGAGATIGGAPRAWSNPSYVTASDSNYATQTMSGTPASNDFLSHTSFGFNIESYQVVKGVMLSFDTLVTAGKTLNQMALENGFSIATLGSIYTVAPEIVDTTYTSWPPIYMWGLTPATLTPSYVNQSSFGFRYRLNGSGLALANVGSMTIWASKPATVDTKSAEFDYEAESIRMVITVTNLEAGYEAGSVGPLIQTFTPKSAEFDFEAYSVPVITVSPISSEYNYEAASIFILQNHFRTPGSAEFDYEAMTVRFFDPFTEFDWETTGPAMTQVHFMTPGSAEFDFEAATVQLLKNVEPADAEFDYAAASVAVITVSPISAEYDYEAASIAVVVNANVFTGTAEFDYEAKSVNFSAVVAGSAEYDYEVVSVAIPYVAIQSPNSSEFSHEISSPQVDFFILSTQKRPRFILIDDVNRTLRVLAERRRVRPEDNSDDR